MRLRKDQRRALISRVMHASDDLVLVIKYRDDSGLLTCRVVSPVKWVGQGQLQAVCLAREAPRHFYLGRCVDVRVAPAAHYVAPVPIEYLED